jgi:hypothetical protein
MPACGDLDAGEASTRWVRDWTTQRDQSAPLRPASFVTQQRVANSRPHGAANPDDDDAMHIFGFE